MIDPVVPAADADQRHVVQFYDSDEQALSRNVAAYFHAGLERGEGGVAIVRPTRRAAFAAALAQRGVDVAAVVRRQQLLFIDAAEALAQIAPAGKPDRRRFLHVVGRALHDVRTRVQSPDVRAYGEMVALLWEEGRRAAAIELESFWNDLLATDACRLFCAYPIDVFGAGFRLGELDGVMCAHTQVIPAHGDGVLERAIDRAMDDVLGAQSGAVRPLMKPNYRPSWAAIPRGEARALWLRNNLPETAGEILDRARSYARANTRP